MGKAYWQLKTFLHEAQWWDRERIAAWQLDKLKNIVKYAYKNVPGYRTLYREAKVQPNDITSLADIGQLPFTTKELLRDNLTEFTARNIAPWQRRYATTGGSTGKPFGFYHTSVNVWLENAFIHSGWEWIGWQTGDLSAVLRGSFTGSQKRIYQHNPVRNELLLSTYHLTEFTYKQYIDVLQKYSPKYLQAYPSAVTILADLIFKHRDVGNINFKGIFLGSENIYAWQKEKLKSVFPGARIFGWYGHTEQAILAPMCEASDEYHLWPFYGLTELLNEADENAQEGELGELVGTSFWCNGTPFIRYRTEDIARRGGNNCPQCKRQFDMLERIEGRKQDYVVTNDGGLVTLTGLIFAQHFHAFGATEKMQLYQDKAGEVIVKVVPTSLFSERDSSEIKTRMETAVGGRLKVTVEIVDDIPRTQRGKYRFLEQKLDIGYGDKQQ
jgi:phenylacetate-CoA ligase